MAQVNPQDFSFHIKKDDLEPPLKIRICDSDSGDVFDLTGYTSKFYMALKSDKSTVKVDAGTVTITDETDGKAEYRWVSGDTDTEGLYYYEFRFETTGSGRPFTVPVVSPGVVYIEGKIG